ncbi:TetR/AcrR family transcriptional regulator C-terminal domain-containing protein [Streptomyces sp. NPDC006733]|uniref:TetR/AcrR family transcriptional regulator C-terminal domain-containing protein n=1 Tax=Streptomyces sp. NPDC006733 TaxID=3155460 RepID=UPI0033CD4569
MPELRRAQFELGKLPYLISVHHLEAQHAAGSALVPGVESATNPFLGMIANYVLRPRMLLAGWSPARADVSHAVEEAITTVLARYGRCANASAPLRAPVPLQVRTVPAPGPSPRSRTTGRCGTARSAS